MTTLTTAKDGHGCSGQNCPTCREGFDRAEHEGYYRGRDGHDDHPLLTPVYGGHVWPGTWEGLAGFAHARCAACGQDIKTQGEFVADVSAIREDASEEHLCPGWPPRRFTGPVLPRVVRAITREASNDKPNGPFEEAIEGAHAAHLAMIAEHDGERMIVRCDRVRADGDAIARMVERSADQDRALRLALEHDERNEIPG